MSKLFVLVVCTIAVCLALAGLSLSKLNTPAVEDLTVVVCHYAVVEEVTDEEGNLLYFLEEDSYITPYIYIPTAQVDAFLEAKLQDDAQDDDTNVLPADSQHYVNRRLTRIRAANVILRQDYDHPELRQLDGDQWRVLWKL